MEYRFEDSTDKGIKTLDIYKNIVNEVKKTGSSVDETDILNFIKGLKKLSKREFVANYFSENHIEINTIDDVIKIINDKFNDDYKELFNCNKNREDFRLDKIKKKILDIAIYPNFVIEGGSYSTKKSEIVKYTFVIRTKYIEPTSKSEELKNFNYTSFEFQANCDISKQSESFINFLSDYIVPNNFNSTYCSLYPTLF